MIVLFTGCGTNNNKIIDIDYDVYYYQNNYVTPTLSTNISKLNTKSIEYTTLLNTELSVSMIRYENDLLYGIFNGKIGYIKDNQVKYITSDNDSISRYYIKNNILYFDKQITSGSYNTLGNFTMIDKTEKSINEMGISQLIVDDYIYFEPNGGIDANKLLQYNLDGTNKTFLYKGNIGSLIISNQYIYYINYEDENSLYRMKKDGTEAKNIIAGPFSNKTTTTNIINGEYKMATIGDTLYYINIQDGYKLYKYDGKNHKLTNDGINSLKAYDGNLFVVYKNRTGLFVLDDNGLEIKQILNITPDEYVID
jgi:hypothetical protein